MTKIIYVISQNFKLVFKIQEILGKDFQIIHLSKLHQIKNGDIVVTDNKSQIKYQNILRIHPDATLLSIKKAVLAYIHKSENAIDTMIGIDPGHTIGIAILFRNRVLTTNVVYTIDGLVQWIKNSLRVLHTKRFTLKIGDGGGKTRNHILDRLVKEFGNLAKMIIVNERNTSIRSNGSLTRHEQAAIRIARRNGTIYRDGVDQI